jgi:hypothetical protein
VFTPSDRLQPAFDAPVGKVRSVAIGLCERCSRLPGLGTLIENAVMQAHGIAAGPPPN